MLPEATESNGKGPIDFGPNPALAHIQDGWGKVCVRSGWSAPGKGFGCSKKVCDSALKKSFYCLRLSTSLVKTISKASREKGESHRTQGHPFPPFLFAKYVHDLKGSTTFPSEKKKWPAQIRAAMNGTGKPLGKLTSLSKCLKCSLFPNPSLKYCFASPMKETIPLHWDKLPKDRAWECGQSWTSPPRLVDASSAGAEGWLSEPQTYRWWLSCHQASLMMSSARPARPLTLETKGGSTGREDACCLLLTRK